MPEERDVTQDSGTIGESATPEQPTGEAAAQSSAEPAYEIDGKSYTAAELKEFRDSGLRHADYTRKTQEIARLREELAPLEQWRNLIQSDPEFVRHLRGYFERTPGQAPGYQEEVDPQVAAIRQQLSQQQAALSQLSGYITRQQLDATVSNMAERYKEHGVTQEFIDREVLPVASRLGQFTPEGLEITLKGILLDRSVQKAKEETEKNMKALGEKRQKATTVRGGGGKITPTATDFSKAESYEQIANMLKASGALDGIEIPEP